MEYSKKLIIKLQKYWKKRFGIDLNEKKANEYLKALADFYTIFAND